MDTQLSPLRKWSILGVLSLALLIIILDTTLLNVSLTSIIKDLNTDLQGIQWVITGYSLTLAALTVTGGRLGDLFGRKKMFGLGAIIFAIGSFITSISTSVPMMIAGEAIIEGIGAALMMPATTSLLISNFKGRDRAIGFGVWGAIASVGSAIGPVVGGFLSTNYSWRWGFRINIVVAAILLVGTLLIPESKDKKEKPTLDIPGVFLSAAGLVSLVYGVIEASTYGWWTAKKDFVVAGYTLLQNYSVTPFAILLGILILIGFVFWELRVDKNGGTPLVSMKLFKNRQFTSGVLLSSTMALGQSGVIFSLPVFLQTVRGLDALRTGYALLPMSFGLLIFSPLGATLTGKIKPKPIVQTGLLLNLAATIIMAFSYSVNANTVNFILPLGLFGAGMGLVMSQLSNLTLSAVSTEQAGEASGVNSTLRTVGSSLGSAIIGAVLLTALSGNLTAGIQNSNVIPDTAKSQIVQTLSDQTSEVQSGETVNTGAQVPTSITDEITKVTHQATSDADRDATFVATIFGIAGLFVSMLLPNLDAKALLKQKGESVASAH
jgi:EmrB/QacA subfamily drug resistance transporter